METNILESQEKEQEKKTSSELDGEVIQEMLMTGENTDGMFTPNEKLDPDDPTKVLHEDVDESAKVTTGKVTKKFGKYQKNFLKDMQKNPGAYKVKTPEGEMPLTEAMKRGYNPITKKFDKPVATSSAEEKLKGLPEDQQAILRTLTNPKSAHMPPSQGQAMGLSPNNPMVAQQMPGAMPPGVTPTPELGQEPLGKEDLIAQLGGTK